MKYNDDEAIREIVQRGRSVRDRRMYGRMCALGGLSVGLAIALIFVLLFGVGSRIGKNGGSGSDVAVISTTQADPYGTNDPGTNAPEGGSSLPPVEFAQDPGGEPGSEDGQVPGGTNNEGVIPGGIPDVGGNPGGELPGETPTVGPGGEPGYDPALPPSMPPQGEKEWIDKAWELEAAAASVLKLDTYDAKGDRICTGSGFVIYNRRFLVTACHVIVNMDHLIATMDWGDTFEVSKVIAVDQARDIAVLQLPEEVDIIPLQAEDGYPTRGGRVVAIGSQFGIVNMITTGMLSGLWVTGDTDRILFTAQVASGSSGGPLIDSTGKVLGVISGTYDGGQNLNIAVPIEMVYRLIESELEVNEE